MALLKASELINREDTRLSITCETTHDLLATSPQDAETYEERGAIRIAEGAPEDMVQDKNLHLLEEVKTLPADEGVEDKKVVTVFHQDAQGIFIWAYQVQGFLKAAGEALRGSSGDEKLDGGSAKGKKWGSIKQKIDRYVVVRPDRLYLYRLDDKGAKQPVLAPDGICTRPLRAMTMRGERVSISRSQMLSPGVRFDCQIDLLSGAAITEAMIVEMLAFGERVGLLQWRNSGKGRFIAYIDADPKWTPAATVKK